MHGAAALYVGEHQLGQVHVQLFRVQACVPKNGLGALAKRTWVACFDGLDLLRLESHAFGHILQGPPFLLASALEQTARFFEKCWRGDRLYCHRLLLVELLWCKCGIGSDKWVPLIGEVCATKAMPAPIYIPLLYIISNFPIGRLATMQMR